MRLKSLLKTSKTASSPNFGVDPKFGEYKVIVFKPLRFKGLKWSGRQDSNLRPLHPQ